MGIEGQRFRQGWVLYLVVLGSSGCLVDAGGTPREGDELGHRSLLPGPRDTSVDLATWNLEWFGHPGRGPRDEDLQRARAQAILGDPDLDLWALQEVVFGFDDLMAGLSGYASILSNDRSVEGHRSYYPGEMKVAFVWRPEVLELLEAEVILREEEYAFAGRPPLRGTFRVRATGEELTVITFHGKAQRAAEDWARRNRAANALEAYLAGLDPTRDVVVLGDFNDDLDESIRRSQPSPYAGLVSRFTFATYRLAIDNVPTTLRGRLPLDHVLVSGPLSARTDATDAAPWPVDQRFSDFGTTTSDHLPVRFSFEVAAPAMTPGSVMIDELLPNEPGSDVSQEAVELVVVGAQAVDLGGWTLEDGVRTRHVFAAGQTLQRGERLVITGGFDYPGDADRPSSSGRLGLNNGGDVVILRDAAGTIVSDVRYGGGAREGVSLVRDQESDPAASLVPHDRFGALHSLGRPTIGR